MTAAAVTPKQSVLRDGPDGLCLVPHLIREGSQRIDVIDI
jgi:hypothetical protein